jgi:hypothetical protein
MKRHSNSLRFAIKDFLSEHKKTFVCFALIFVAGIVVGIVSEVNSVGGQFERINKNDIVFGQVKVFFFSSLILAVGYGVLVLSSTIKTASFIAIIPFAIVGYMFGAYTTVLVGVYGGVGVINLLFVYVPFFTITFFVLSVTGCVALRSGNSCGCKEKFLKPSVSILLKGYVVNVIASFVIFLLVGSVTKVVVVVL